ncbi:MAG: arsenic efflux protein [Bacteroidales bacterium]|nr:arsenic efflux protein [Bacteroidales bacterium]
MLEMTKLILQQTLLITGFVVIMMMLIEYVNILSRGNWMNRLKKSPVGQVVLGTILGMIPGCLGTYTAVSLYTHRLLSFGALVAALIATSGDETFLMLALIPKQALIIMFGTGIIALISGLLIDKYYKRGDKLLKYEECFTIHCEELKTTKSRLFKDLSYKNFRFTWQRILALVVFAFFMIAPFVGLIEHEHHILLPSPNEAVSTELHELHAELHHSNEGHNLEENGHHEHDHINWIGITLAFVSFLGFLITATSTEHFLKDHIIKHVIKKHLPKVFLWTLVALIAIRLMLHYTDFGTWISANLYIVLLLAVLIGIIPESGPHLLFLSMYISGAIPLSILFANSIVQDGHGSLPLFAESKKSFFVAKLFNVLIGLAVGLVGLFFGF